MQVYLDFRFNSKIYYSDSGAKFRLIVNGCYFGFINCWSKSKVVLMLRGLFIGMIDVRCSSFDFIC